MRELTDKQRRVLQIIQRTVRLTGDTPTYREIAAEFGVDVRAAYQHVSALERKGVLERTSSGIVLSPEHMPPVGVPLVGRVAAGSPILAEENIEEHVDISREFGLDASGGAEDTFLLRVRGDSMIDAGINDGDLVLVRRQPTVNDGEIAAVVIGDEATAKRVRFVRGGVRLEPANTRYRPMTFGPGDDVRIAGKVLMALRVISPRSTRRARR